MTNVLVLGGGMVGGFIARTLAADAQLSVTVADVSGSALADLQERAAADGLRLSTDQADLSDGDVLRKVLDGADIVVGAVPGWMGYRTLETVLTAGRDCVDISFFPEDSLTLDGLARQRGARAIADCGVMPGLGGMLALRMARELEAEGAAPQRMSIMVGGLPQERRWPLEYKAPFSPSDVLEEYVRPARLRRGGRPVELPALSEPELIDFPGVGTLEAFNTDGLRTLLSTLDVPDMAEKTLRYPGHRDRLAFMSALGFFDGAPVRVRGAEVAPVELTAALLERVWRLDPGEPEFTAMRVEVAAEGRLRRCDLLDRTDPATGDSSMARTTGWPAVLAVRLLLAGGWDRPGVTAPELLAADDAAWGFMLDGLAAAGIELSFSRS